MSDIYRILQFIGEAPNLIIQGAATMAITWILISTLGAGWLGTPQIAKAFFLFVGLLYLVAVVVETRYYMVNKTSGGLNTATGCANTTTGCASTATSCANTASSGAVSADGMWQMITNSYQQWIQLPLKDLGEFMTLRWSREPPIVIEKTPPQRVLKGIIFGNEKSTSSREGILWDEPAATETPNLGRFLKGRLARPRPGLRIPRVN